MYKYSISKAHRYFDEIQEQKAIDYYADALKLYNIAEGTKAPANVKPEFYRKQFKNLMEWFEKINPFNREKRLAQKKNPLINLLSNKTIFVPIVEEPIKKESDTK